MAHCDDCYVGYAGKIAAVSVMWPGLNYSLVVTLPALGALFLLADRG